MKKNLFVVCLFLFIFCFAASTHAQEKIYQRAKLMDIRIEKEGQTIDYQMWNSQLTRNPHRKSSNNTATTNLPPPQRDKGSAVSVPIQTGQEKAYIDIELNGILYTGEYHPRASSRGRLGSEWVIGDPVDVRLNQKETNLYLLQKNGQELRVPLLRKERIR